MRKAVREHWGKIASIVGFVSVVVGLLIAFDIKPRFWAFPSEVEAVGAAVEAVEQDLSTELKRVAGDLYSDQIINARRERSDLEELIREHRAKNPATPVPQWMRQNLEDVKERIRSLEIKQKKARNG